MQPPGRRQSAEPERRQCPPGLVQVRRISNPGPPGRAGLQPARSPTSCPAQRLSGPSGAGRAGPARPGPAGAGARGNLRPVKRRASAHCQCDRALARPPERRWLGRGPDSESLPVRRPGAGAADRRDGLRLAGGCVPDLGRRRAPSDHLDWPGSLRPS